MSQIDSSQSRGHTKPSVTIEDMDYLHNLDPLSAGSDTSSEPDLVEQAVLADMKDSFGELGRVMISSKIAEQSVLQRSVAEGGPASSLHAILNTMDYLKIGVRTLSREASIKRNTLNNMLAGRMDIPPEVFARIWASFAKRRPDMFNSTNV